jgi:anti-sigma regulatory factor (Ser/Thr protein kinase)/biotin operon repressor/uncharacterized protein (DUF1330 family)
MRVRKRGEEIRQFILEKIEAGGKNINQVVSARFGITRQAVHKHIQRLVSEGVLEHSGSTKDSHYKLCPLQKWQQNYSITKNLAEDIVWSESVSEKLEAVPENVRSIWYYGFTEMFNNAIDHSAGSKISVSIEKTAAATLMILSDNGIGIFKKIQKEFDLDDERHAVLELSKGKLTTDPKNHSGQGIFFTSRMFDDFAILSGGVYFSHKFADPEDWILEMKTSSKGTYVFMKLNNHTARTTKKVFDQFSIPKDGYGFDKTVVPVALAQYGNDFLVSRSQAKRILARVDRFKVVIFDFKDVQTIGQAFADEIFRVFAKQHPDIELTSIHTNSDVKRMILRAKES